MVDFGQRLKALRKGKHLTQEQLSRKLGLTKSVISAYESSLRYPSYEVLIALSDIFSVTTDYLLGQEKEALADLSKLSKKHRALVLNLIDALEEGDDEG